MRLQRGIERLPVEMMMRAFGYLDIHDVLAAAHVCRDWRPIALDAPAFWRDIAVRDMSPLTIEMAALQLRSARGRWIDFRIDYSDVDPAISKKVVPLLRAAVPIARWLKIRIESLYRQEVEDAFRQDAPNLEHLKLFYMSQPLPELHLTMPLGGASGATLFNGIAGKLDSIYFRNVILPMEPIPAFLNAEEVFFLHGESTVQQEFPVYLFRFFPKVTRLRISGGTCWFKNEPLPDYAVAGFAQLTSFDVAFSHRCLAGFFAHLPIHTIPEVLFANPDEDTIYSALEPLRSPFRLAFSQKTPDEFFVTVTGRDSTLVRSFPESRRFYFPGSEQTNLLLQNEEFAEQLGSMEVYVSLWTFLVPWLPPLKGLPALVLILDEDISGDYSLPKEPLSLPSLTSLVLEAKGESMCIAVSHLLDFVSRITPNTVTLELRRVRLSGPRDLTSAQFSAIQETE